MGPGADIGKRPEPVDAGVGPEVDQHHTAAQAFWGQWRRVEPPGRAVEPRQVTLDRQGSRFGTRSRAEQAHLPRPPRSRTASANASGASWGRLWPTPPPMVRCEYSPENLPA